MKGLIIVFLLLLSGCSTEGSEVKGEVYTTAKPLADISQAILGNEYSAATIYPEDSDPHHYELTAQDMAKIAESNMFVYISDSNNSFTADLKASGEYNTEFLSVTNDQSFIDGVDSDLYDSEVIESNEEHEHEDEDHDEHTEIEGEIVDPHVWVSPQKLMLIGDVLLTEYQDLFSDDADTFASNWQEYRSQLEELDREYREFATEQQYPIIVSHSAYNYLDYDYGITSQSLYGLVSEDEPTAKEIEATIDLINEAKIPAIYVEQNDIDNKVIKQIANETGTEIRVLNNMSTTSVDTLTALTDNLTALSILK